MDMQISRKEIVSVYHHVRRKYRINYMADSNASNFSTTQEQWPPTGLYTHRAVNLSTRSILSLALSFLDD